MITGSCPNGRFQPARYLLGKHHRKLQAIQCWTVPPEVKFSSVEGIVKEIRIEGSLDCRDHVLVKFMILRNVSLAEWSQDWTSRGGTSGSLRNFWTRSLGKLGCVISEKYRNVVWTYRDEVRKTKAQMERILERDIKNNKKGFCRYIWQKRQAKDSVPPLINEKELATQI